MVIDLLDCLGLQTDSDSASSIGELEGVGDEVEQDLLEPPLVTVDHREVLLLAFFYQELGRDALPGRQEFQGFERVIDRLNQAEE